LAAGKLAECVLRLLQHETAGTYTPFGQHIKNFAAECHRISQTPATIANESLRVVIPLGLQFVYTLRNKRGIGHVGGDVDPNAIDAEAMARGCDWIVAELIRNYHKLSLEEAQDIVETLAQRSLPEVWDVGEKRRVLRSGLDYSRQVLLLCYTDPAQHVLSEDLFEWVEYSNLSVFKKNVLQSLHRSRLIEYDQEAETVRLSPKGARLVEKEILGSRN